LGCNLLQDITVKSLKTTINNLLTSESTYVDFKVSLEKAKPKTWLKTVVAFANGLGGTILFGVDDDRNIIGLKDIHGDSEKISNLIKTKIDPILMFELQPVVFEGKYILLLNISSGKMTPYYYVNDGARTAFVRIGNESVTAPSYLIHELTLKGKSLSFDALSTSEGFDDASFTLFKSIFLKVTGKRIEGKKDYLSFGMIDAEENLTYAGLLLSDECALLQSRVFCTKWIGNSKGKRSIIASDVKEYSGNVIMLLKE
jgi:ATP-dependent DNA helicase RecG